ncbi:hypothetical protein B0T10DRAFT_261507 [Thelonectria olida]|uniref:Uncharacterized protein n=1 Tax=Thelonectria olida TaxID=1576542 RepID=A0A9P8VP45_9HYPO|nr:hypothetical protein B0T10DRAFT_261507 [Thelonectria olida]
MSDSQGPPQTSNPQSSGLKNVGELGPQSDHQKIPPYTPRRNRSLTIPTSPPTFWNHLSQLMQTYHTRPSYFPHNLHLATRVFSAANADPHGYPATMVLSPGVGHGYPSLSPSSIRGESFSLKSPSHARRSSFPLLNNYACISTSKSTNISANTLSARHYHSEISLPSLQERLWNQAYDELKASAPKVVGAYEAILSARLGRNDSASVAFEPTETRWINWLMIRNMTRKQAMLSNTT